MAIYQHAMSDNTRRKSVLEASTAFPVFEGYAAHPQQLDM